MTIDAHTLDRIITELVEQNALATELAAAGLMSAEDAAIYARGYCAGYRDARNRP